MARLSPPYDTLSRAERGSPRAGVRTERRPCGLTRNAARDPSHGSVAAGAIGRTGEIGCEPDRVASRLPPRGGMPHGSRQAGCARPQIRWRSWSHVHPGHVAGPNSLSCGRGRVSRRTCARCASAVERAATTEELARFDVHAPAVVSMGSASFQVLRTRRASTFPPPAPSASELRMSTCTAAAGAEHSRPPLSAGRRHSWVLDASAAIQLATCVTAHLVPGEARAAVRVVLVGIDAVT